MLAPLLVGGYRFPCTGPALATIKRVKGPGPRVGGLIPQMDKVATLRFAMGIHGGQVLPQTS